MSSKSLKPAPKPSGKQIRKALIDLDMTPRELADAMGVSVLYIRFIFAERRKARELRKRIARFLEGKYRSFNWEVPTGLKKPGRKSVNHNNEKEKRAA